MDTRNKIFAVVGTVAILGTAGAVGALLFTQQNTSSTGTTTTSSQNSSSSSSSGSSSTTTTSGNYKDGTYAATQSYSVPHGDTNTIKVTVTISGGKITSVTTSDEYVDHESAMYIQSFENSVSNAVVGQSIGSTSFSRVGGASLTSSAFYDALDTIATQAQA